MSISTPEIQDRQVVVIDYSVTDLQTLIEELPEGMPYIVVEPSADGMAQLADQLAAWESLTAIHLVTHGAPGGLLLGNTWLEQDHLQQHAQALQRIGETLTPEGDLLLYGCEVAQGEAGTEFIRRLAEFTGADVAASTDFTGAHGQGGNWVLEQGAGPVETSELRLTGYGALLTNSRPVLTDTILTLNTIVEDAGAPVGAVGTLVSSLIGASNYSDGDGNPAGLVITSVDPNLNLYISTNNGAIWSPVNGTVSEASAVTLYANTATRVYLRPDANFNGNVSDALVLRAWDRSGGFSNGQTGADIVDRTQPQAVRVGGFDTSGTAYGVAVSGDYAYVADGYSGLQIIDIRNPASPSRIGGLTTTGYAGVVVSGDYAYVADSSAGLQIIDIHNPASPSRVGGLDTSGYAYGVAVSSGYAYVADGSSGLQIIDIRNPASPSRAGGFDTSGWAYDVAVSGNYAYVADDVAGLQIIDIRNPAYPSRVGGFDTSGRAHGVAVSGNYAYVADDNAGLQIIDIRNPASPSRVGGFDTSGNAYDVVVSGGYAYIADRTAGLQIIDIRNPASPSHVGGLDTSGAAYGVVVSGDYAYVADDSAGLQVIKPFSTPLPAFSMASDSASLTVTAVNDAPVISSNGGGASAVISIQENTTAITTVTATDIDSPTLSYSLIGGAEQARFRIDASTGVLSFITAPNFEAPGDSDGNNVYDVIVQVSDGSASDSQSISVSVSNAPDTPVLLDTALRLVSVGEDSGAPVGAVGTLVTALIGAGNYRAEDADPDPIGLAITGVKPNLSLYISTNDGATWTPVGGTVSETSAVALYADSATRVFLQPSLNYNGNVDDALALRAWNRSGGFSNGQTGVNIVETQKGSVGGYDTSDWAEDVVVSGDYAYVADRGSGLQILDIRNPANPSRVGGFDTTGLAFDVAVSGNYAYVADWGSGLQILDIRNPASPSRVGGFDTSGLARGVEVSGNYAYIADDTAGLQIIDIRNPANPNRVGGFNTSGTASGVTVRGNYAYVADGGSGLQIIDISNPASPSRVGGFDTPNNAESVAVSDEYAYIADNGAGLQIIDIRNPASPSWVSSFDTSGYDFGVALSGNYAYVAGTGTGLQIIDIRNPASPTRVGDFAIGGNVDGVTVSGDYAYVANAHSGLQVFKPFPTLLPAFSVDSDSASLTVTASNDAPMIISDGSGASAAISVQENTTTVATVTASDIDSLALTYSLIGGADQARFRIDATSGALAFHQPPDYEAPADSNQDNRYEVVVQASDGSASDSQSITVSVTNLALELLDTALSLNSVSEDAGAPTGAVGTLVSSLIGAHNYRDDSGDSPGLVITSVDPNLNLYISTNDGATWTPVSGAVSQTSAVTLYADSATRVYLQPDADFSGNLADALVLQAWDRSGGFSNGQTGVGIFEPTQPGRVGGFDTSGYANDVVVSGGYAYVADGSSGLQIIDIRNPASPSRVGGFNTSGAANHVVVSGNYAYVADDFAGLQIIDIRNPASPSRVGGFDTSGYAYGVAVSGDYAYVADHSAGLQIIDIRNPASPSRVGGFDTSGYAYGVAVSGVYAYIADGGSGLQIIDIRNPTNPSRVGGFDTAGIASGIAVSGGYAYVAYSVTGLQIIDIRNQASPSYVGSFETLGYAYGVAMSGGYAYVANDSTGLQIIDIHNPASPNLVDSFDTSGNAEGVTVSGDYAYVADGSSGLHVIRPFPTLLPSFSVASDCASLTVTAVNDAPVVTSNGGGESTTISIQENNTTVTTVTATDIDSPTLSYSLIGGADQARFRIDASTGALSFLAAPNFEAPADNDGNNVYEVIVQVSDGNASDSQSISVGVTNLDQEPPVLLDTLLSLGSVGEDTGAPAGAVGTLVSTLIGAHNYRDDNGDLPGLAITGVNPNLNLYISTNDGATWTPVSGVVSPTSAVTLYADSATRVYLQPEADFSGDVADALMLRAWDRTGGFSNGQTGADIVDHTQSQAVRLGGFNTPGNAYDVAISGDYAYVADDTAGLQIIDIRNPASPSRVGGFDTSGAASRVAVSGDYAYVADGDSGLQIIDIRNPASPSRVGGFDTSGMAWGVEVSGDYAYVADDTAGLQILDIRNPASPSRVGGFNTAGNAVGVTVSGGYAYVADGNSGLQVIDIRNPTSTSRVGGLDTSGYAIAVAVSGNFAYVADGDSGLQIMDIRNPASPSRIGGFDTSGNAYDVTVSGGYAFVADDISGLQILDIRNPASPSRVDRFDTTGAAFGVAVRGDYAYVADYASGLQVIKPFSNLLPSFSAVSDSASLTVTPGNDAPTLVAPIPVIYANNPGNDHFAPVTGILSASDADADALSFGIVGGTLASGVVSRTGTYGTLQVNATTGAYTFTPNDAAIEAIQADVSESHTITVSDGTVSTEALFSIQLQNIVPLNIAPTFGINGTGMVKTDFGPGEDFIKSVVVQSDGRIVAGGYSHNGSNYDFALARYTANGILDTSFSGDGKVTTSISNGNDRIVDIAILPNGRILAGGTIHQNEDIPPGSFALARYSSDGTLDTSFSGDGMLTSMLNQASEAYAMALQADGKIVMAGLDGSSTWSSSFALARYNNDGTFDTSFSGDGKVFTAVGSQGESAAHAVAMQSDGKILAAGHAQIGGLEKYALARYNADGSLDTGFGSNGSVITVFGNGDYEAHSVALQADGKILLTGVQDDDHYPSVFNLVRYNSNGTLDTTFGAGGIVTTAVGGDDGSGAVLVQPDGRILVAGYSITGNDGVFVLVRYLGNGSLDTSFSGDGVATANLGPGVDGGLSLALQADGRILLGGVSIDGVPDSSTPSTFALVRFNADGSLDTSFGATNLLDGAPAFTEGGAAVVLDSNVQVQDAELQALGHFGGTSLTLTRHGGANAQDQFSASGSLGALTQGGALLLAGVNIGVVTSNSGGVLRLDFNSQATQDRVNQTLQQIAYANTSNTPPASVQIDWTFNDGNSGAQGSGGALSVTGHTTVLITAVESSNTQGGPGNDTLVGTAGNDDMAGRAGNDTYIVNAIGDSVNELPGEGIDTVRSSISWTLGANLEDLVLTGNGHLSGTGNALGNRITGNAGNNTLNGGAGSDTLVGGAGNDTYVVDHRNDVVTESGPLNGADTVRASLSWTLGANLENLVLTGNGHLSGTGNALGNRITGNAGNNTLNGGAGTDTLVGGAGNDTYVVDHVNDVVTESGPLNGADTVRASLSWTLGANLENLALTGVGHFSGTGNALGNHITGNAGNNTLSGGAGTDTLVGGAGNDTYVVDHRNDVVTETSSLNGADTVRASLSWTLGPNLENLTLTGTGHHSGTGNALNNSLFGNSGNNALNGGNGNDMLNGNSGADTLTGGNGQDTFIFSTALGNSNVDRITDFDSGVDKIKLVPALFSQMGFTGAPASDAFFHMGTSAQDANDRILYNQSTGMLSYDADGTGALAAVQFAVLNDMPALLYSDFIVG